MADKELRRMNRTELIEIIYALEQNEQKLQDENDKLNAELDDRRIRLDQSGSIADAALSLNHIFEDAQAAADQYLLSLQRGEEEQPETVQDQPGETETGLDEPPENKTGEKKPETAGEARETVPDPVEILEDARRQADEILKGARRQADDIIASARDQAETAEGNEPEEVQPQSEKILEVARRQADEILENARQEADDIQVSARENAQAESRKTLEKTKEQCDKERQAVKEYHDRFLQDISDVLRDNPELLERVRQLGSVEGA